jgi:hypothetical protein
MVLFEHVNVPSACHVHEAMYIYNHRNIWVSITIYLRSTTWCRLFFSNNTVFLLLTTYSKVYMSIIETFPIDLFYYKRNLYNYDEYRNLTGSTNLFSTEKVTLLGPQGPYKYIPSETPCNQSRGEWVPLTTREDAIRAIELELSIRKRCTTWYYHNKQLYDYDAYTREVKTEPTTKTYVTHMDERNMYIYTARSPCNANYKRVMAYASKDAVLSAIGEDIEIAVKCNREVPPIEEKKLQRPPNSPPPAPVTARAPAPARHHTGRPWPGQHPVYVAPSADDDKEDTNATLWIVIAIILGFFVLALILGMIFLFMRSPIA